MPFISVIVTAHNRRDYLRDAVDSVLNQTIDDYEIIVVKNFKDEIDDYLKENGVKSVLVGDQTQGMDIISGLNEARGEVISFLDDDDLFLPRKLEKVKEVFQDEEVGYYHNAFENFNCKSKPSINIYSPNNILKLSNHRKLHTIRLIYRYNGIINSSSISIRKNIIYKHINILPKINITIDIFLFLIGYYEQAPIVIDNNILTLRRLHNKNTGAIKSSNMNNWIEKKIDLLEKQIGDFTIFKEIFQDSNVINKYINYEISSRKILLMQFPSFFLSQRFKIGLNDLYYKVLFQRNIRSFISFISTFLPDSLKWKIIDLKFKKENKTY